MSTANLDISSAPIRLKDLFKTALLVREKAHSPYSGHKVGAAIRTLTDEVYSGCNVENSSYGATVCAERVAIQKAVSEQGNVQIAEVMVVTDSLPPWPPCGLCRQVIAEFAQGNIIIYAANVKGSYYQATLDELLPHAFTPAKLAETTTAHKTSE